MPAGLCGGRQAAIDRAGPSSWLRNHSDGAAAGAGLRVDELLAAEARLTAERWVYMPLAGMPRRAGMPGAAPAAVGRKRDKAAAAQQGVGQYEQGPDDAAGSLLDGTDGAVERLLEFSFCACGGAGARIVSVATVAAASTVVGRDGAVITS